MSSLREAAIRRLGTRCHADYPVRVRSLRRRLKLKLAEGFPDEATRRLLERAAEVEREEHVRNLCRRLLRRLPPEKPAGDDGPAP